MMAIEDFTLGGREQSGGGKPSVDVKTKQQKKEEGRRRALEISMRRLHVSDILNDDTNTKLRSQSHKRANRKSDRHGARNQHRHKHFARWILERFPHVVGDCSCVSVKAKTPTCEPDASDDDESTQMHILDVAGGKGELSARLSLCHSLHVVMIDPRRADIASVYMNSVVPKLPKKWQGSVKERLQQSPTFVQDELDSRFRQLVKPFSSPSLFGLPVNSYQDRDLDDAVKNASLLLGLHADGATEAIVDAALLYRKPFVVVPCCVFPNLFHQRYIYVPVDEDTHDTGMSHVEKDASEESKHTPDQDTAPKQKRVPVRSHEQFCQYLLAKHPRFVMEVLPFDGRNVAIWWDGQ